jgi:hypothetical protein
VPAEERRWRLLRSGQDQRGGKWRWSRRRKKPAGSTEAAGPLPPVTAAPLPTGDPALDIDVTAGELEKARRNLRRAEEIVARQTDLVFEIRRHGRPSEQAERLLRTFQDVLRECTKHLMRLQILARKGAPREPK